MEKNEFKRIDISEISINKSFLNEYNDDEENEAGEEDYEFCNWDDFDPNKAIECPCCGNDAYWNGYNYDCEQCNWYGMPDNDVYYVID